MSRTDAQVIVIGSGIGGLCCAALCARAGREVLVLEAERHFGTGTSSRNSEVIHAGIYYPAGSLKARLCVEGRRMLYDYCAARGVAHRRLGKLIVATCSRSSRGRSPTASRTSRRSTPPRRGGWSRNFPASARCTRARPASSTATA